jgi:protein TonB
MRSGLTHPDETAASEQHDRAADLLGAVVPSRLRERPEPTERADLSNVIPFHPRRTPDKPAIVVPSVVCTADSRPCPFLTAFPWRRQWQWPVLLVSSVAAHAGLFAWFLQEPPPKASIGLEVISVEMVLGAQSEAGTAEAPGEATVDSAYTPDLAPPDDTKTELTEKPVTETKEEPREIAEDLKPVVHEEPKPQIVAAAPPEPLPAPELSADPEPKKEPAVEAVKEQPKPVAAKPVTEKGKAKKQRIAAPSQHSVAASGVGRGSSQADANYRGMVIAHLSRHKQFPADARARGDTGIASVTFSISGSGAVTSVRLARSSGSSSLDREVQAMVRRASPFPPPPSGQPMSFTAPVNFNLR